MGTNEEISYRRDGKVNWFLYELDLVRSAMEGTAGCSVPTDNLAARAVRVAREAARLMKIRENEVWKESSR